MVDRGTKEITSYKTISPDRQKEGLVFETSQWLCNEIPFTPYNL